MIWCLSLAILSLIISQGADGELHSWNSRTPKGWLIPQRVFVRMGGED